MMQKRLTALTNALSRVARRKASAGADEPQHTRIPPYEPQMRDGEDGVAALRAVLNAEGPAPLTEVASHARAHATPKAKATADPFAHAALAPEGMQHAQDQPCEAAPGARSAAKDTPNRKGALASLLGAARLGGEAKADIALPARVERKMANDPFVQRLARLS